MQVNQSQQTPEFSYLEAFNHLDNIAREVFGEAPGFNEHDPARVKTPTEVDAAFKEMHEIFSKHQDEGLHIKFLLRTADVLVEYQDGKPVEIANALNERIMPTLHEHSLVPTVTNPDDSDAVANRKVLYEK